MCRYSYKKIENTVTPLLRLVGYLLMLFDMDTIALRITLIKLLLHKLPPSIIPTTNQPCYVAVSMKKPITMKTQCRVPLLTKTIQFSS